MNIKLDNIFARFDKSETILNAISNPIIIMGFDKTIHFINSAAERILLIPKERCVGKSCEIFNTPYCHNSDCCIEKFLRGEEGQIQYGPGDSITRVNISLLKDMNDEPVAYISISTDIRELIETQRKLKISQQLYETALCQSKTAMWSYAPAKKCLTQLNDGQLAALLFGDVDTIDNFPESTIENAFIHQDSVTDIHDFCEKIRNNIPECSTTIKFKQWSDSYCWIHIKSTSIFDEKGALIEAIIVAKDITEQKILEMKYEKEKSYRAAISAGYIGIYEFNLTKNELVNITKSLFKELDINRDNSNYDYLQQKIFELANKEDCEELSQQLNRSYLIEQFSQGITAATLEYKMRSNDSYRWVNIFTSIFYRDGSEDIYACVYLKDIHEQKEKEKSLIEKAEKDHLTGLYNRNAIEELINLTLSYNDEKYHALMILDIDNFKEVNDTYGHIMGDNVLSEVASKISNVFDENVIIGRLGGDEFMIFMSDVTNPIVAEEKAALLCRDLRIFYNIQEKRVQISASIGLAFAPEHGLSFNELYKKADLAMYCVKKRGKNQWVSYQDQMDCHFETALVLE